jgi:alpha-tubulin suppressor-like RCC1 family protein
MTKIPRRVEALAGISIEKVSCGDEMTCCLSEEGEIYICGNNINGCLGLGNENSSFDLGDENSDSETSNSNNDSINELMNVSTPIKIPFFKSKDLRIKSIACGDLHTIALSTCNRVFTWGCGEYGRLGHGDEDDRYTRLYLRYLFVFKQKINNLLSLI